jgi:LEA14-like dessication related protein
VLSVVALLLQACSGLLPSYETPTVGITSVRAVPSQGALPDFEIGLRVINPNREALRLAGISYTVSLEGNELIKGVGRDFPEIPGYGQEDLTITASANLFAGIRLFSELLNTPRDSFRYDIEAKLDLGGLRPTINVRDSGSLSLNGTR